MFKSFFRRLWQDIRLPLSDNPRSFKRFWTGASLGAWIFTLLVWGIAGYHFRTGLPPALMAIAGILTGAAAAAIFSALSMLTAYSARALPNFFFAAMGGAIGSLITAHFVRFRWPDELFYPAAFIFLWVNALLAASLWMLISGQAQKRRWILITLLFITLTLDGLGIWWLAYSGNDPHPLPASQWSMPTLAASGLTNPGEKGSLSHEHFTYGSGTDRQRHEYGEEVRFRTPPVDATRLLPEWKGSKKKWRERYWGFGPANFPLNGRVWMPAGAGPFPLVLIVHGNHGMEDYSDAGYAYLGKLLASRGFIAVSVDENFVNGTWSGDFRGREMPVRAWLLLKHLEQWRNWNDDDSHPLASKADLEKVLLIGHSRGGEAIAIAAAFNQLPRFPDNALEIFNFGFGIRGLVAIAPTDKRYQRRIELEDISYLSLQGSYDSDEASFFGLRQYQRISFSGPSPHFKAGLLIHRANHGQFNTSWGRADAGAPYRWLLNLEPLISGEEQRRIARSYIGAFAETVLHGRREYLPLFRDAGAAREWLPETVYLNNFKDSQARILLSFEEDINPVSGPGSITVQAENFRVWREEELRFRDQDTQGNKALVLGWDYGEKMPAPDSTAVYRIELPDSMVAGQLPVTAFLLSVAAGNPDELKEKGKTPSKEEPIPDFTIEIEDTLGRRASVNLSQVRQVAPRLQIQFLKTKALSKPLGDIWEPALETFEIAIDNIQTTNGAFAPTAISRISLIFDRTLKGVVIIDEIGFKLVPPKTFRTHNQIKFQ